MAEKGLKGRHMTVKMKGTDFVVKTKARGPEPVDAPKLSAAILSMLISNTSTTLIMMPMAVTTGGST